MDGTAGKDPTAESRRGLACIYCRSKKIKCSRTKPCENCMDRNEECIYPFMKRRVGTARSKPREELEERLARMEMLLELSSIEIAAINSPVGEQQLESSHSTKSAEVQNTRNDGHLRSLVTNNAFGLLDGTDPTGHSLSDASSVHSQPTREKPYLTQSLHSTQHTPPDAAQTSSQHVECADLLGSEVGWEYHGPTSFLSICSVPGITWVSERSREPGFLETARTLVRNIDSRLKMRPNFRREPISEPNLDSAWEYSQTYFEHSFDASLGLVSRHHFEARLRHHYAQNSMIDDDPAWYALRNTVYASGYRLKMSSMPYSNTSEEIQGKAWRYFEKAMSVHNELLYCSTGLMAVQALTAMSFFAEGLGSQSLGYMLSSCAMRLAQAKGLHRQPAQSWNLPEAEQEHRMRLFWTLYIFEKHISYRSGRPSIIDDDDISSSLPTLQDTGSTDMACFTYIVQHAQISSRISKQLASGKSFRQTPAKIIEVIRNLNTELDQWRDSLPLFLRPDLPTRRHGQQLHNINMYLVMYIRYAYFGSVMGIHSILTHPWNSALFGSSQTPALHHDISISAHVVVNAARSIILDTDVIHTDVSTPIWLALYFPLVSAINIFIYILKYPTLPTAPSDLALLDIATGHFTRLELASPDIALPFVREIARLARTTVEFTKNNSQSTGSLEQSSTLSAPQTFETSV